MDHAGDGQQLRRGIARGRHEDGIHQHLRGPADGYFAAGEFRQHAALRRTERLHASFDRGAPKSQARLTPLSHRGIRQEQCVFRHAAAGLTEGGKHQQKQG
jgi:hypothetical protein